MSTEITVTPNFPQAVPPLFKSGTVIFNSEDGEVLLVVNRRSETSKILTCMTLKPSVKLYPFGSISERRARLYERFIGTVTIKQS